MDSKNYTDVLINGKIYTLGGAEEESYLQQVASYINEKMSELQRQPGFQRQSDDYKSVMIFLNLADDYFKERQYADRLEHENQNLEKETYSLKHELVSTQMKLEALHRETEDLRRQLQELMLRVPGREEMNDESGTAQETETLTQEEQDSLEG